MPSTLRRQLLALRPALAAAANQVLAGWDQDAEGVCEVFGTGGACDAVADALAGVLSGLPDDVTVMAGGQDGDDHAFLIVYDATTAFVVDIPPGVYETGGGYVWRKRRGVVVEPDDVLIEAINRGDIDDD